MQAELSWTKETQGIVMTGFWLGYAAMAWEGDRLRVAVRWMPAWGLHCLHYLAEQLPNFMLITHLYMLISGVVLAVVYVLLTEFILSPQQPLNLGKGVFLLATEVPNDHDNRSIWSESVILLLSHSRSGAKGVIINQPHYDFDVDVDVETLLPPPSPPEGNIGRTHRLISTNAAAHGLFTTAECAASQSPIFGSHYLETYASANVWPPGWGTAADAQSEPSTDGTFTVDDGIPHHSKVKYSKGAAAAAAAKCSEQSSGGGGGGATKLRWLEDPSGDSVPAIVWRASFGGPVDRCVLSRAVRHAREKSDYIPAQITSR
jgi:hypothetical protein